MPRWIWWFIALSVGALLWAANRSPTVAFSQPLPGQAAPHCLLTPPPVPGGEPLQTGVPPAMAPFRHKQFTVTPLAGFSIEARVLGREDYRFDTESAFSPTDLALGWRGMAEPQNYRRLNISQSGRWYRYQWGAEGPPLPPAEIVRTSANMHLVPADENVARALSRVRPDQTVRIQGWLVEAHRDDGWRWRSSLTREDSGAGACELIYVCALSSY